MKVFTTLVNNNYYGHTAGVAGRNLLDTSNTVACNSVRRTCLKDFASKRVAELLQSNLRLTELQSCFILRGPGTTYTCIAFLFFCIFHSCFYAYVHELLEINPDK